MDEFEDRHSPYLARYVRLHATDKSPAPNHIAKVFGLDKRFNRCRLMYEDARVFYSGRRLWPLHNVTREYDDTCETPQWLRDIGTEVYYTQRMNDRHTFVTSADDLFEQSHL